MSSVADKTGMHGSGEGRIDIGGLWTNMYHMKTVNVRDVRNRFSSLEAWVEAGEKIEVCKRGRPIAWIVPIPRDRRKTAAKPNFAARRRKIFGKTVFTAAEVEAMREAEREGEEG